MKWVVTWCIMQLMIDPVQPDHSSYDEFGRDRNAGVVLAVMPLMTWRKTADKEKEFTSSKEAYEFYNSALNAPPVGYGGMDAEEIDCLKIDSIKIK